MVGEEVDLEKALEILEIKMATNNIKILENLILKSKRIKKNKKSKSEGHKGWKRIQG